jgi:predicted GNAT family N-acyltransferase
MVQRLVRPRVAIVKWAEAEQAVRPIREEGFIHEQGVPEELERDGLDPICVHVVAWSEIGDAIGTARMEPGGKIGRMAVLTDWRRRGVGQALLHALLELAARRGISRVTLAAQTHAIGFYERCGFHGVGALFMDAGIWHRLMVRELLQKPQRNGTLGDHTDCSD